MWVLLLGCSLALTLTLHPAGAAAADDGVMRVGIGRLLDLVQVAAEGTYQVVDLTTGATVHTAGAAEVLTLRPAAGGIQVAGHGFFPGPLRLVPAEPPDGETNFVRFKQRRYRGELEILLTAAGRLSVVNVVPVEQYLRGVLPREMSPSWPMEALKAQAVAARSWALVNRQDPRFAGEGFHVDDTDRSQVYGGVVDEHPRTDQAVLETVGEVLTFNGAVIPAYYSSASGGHTEHNEFVWQGDPRPYLRGVPDFDTGSPYYRWVMRLTLPEIEAAFRAEGYDVGRLQSLRGLEPRGVSGRWLSLVLEGSGGQTVVSAGMTRYALSLRSTMFDIIHYDGSPARLTHDYAPRDEVTVIGAAGPARTVRLADSFVLRSAAVAAVSDGMRAESGLQAVPAHVALHGGGWGHGVGMTQWGARGMAESGYSYREILAHYYQGTQLARLGQSVAETR